MMIIFKYLILFLSFFLLACSGKNSAETVLEDYLNQVEMATGVNSQPITKFMLENYPARRDRALPVEDVRIGMLEFFNFSDCDLFNLISERNSILGKVMPVSQRLVYEIEFMHGINNCYSRPAEDREIDQSFRNEIKRIIRIKNDNLSRVFWNATFDSPEMQKTFSLAGRPLDLNEEQAIHVDSLRIIEYFTKIGSHLNNPQMVIDIGELENKYYKLQLHQYGGRLLTTISQLMNYLNRVAYSLEITLKNRSLCHQNNSNQKLSELEGIFRNHYTDRVQPYLTKTYQQGREWLDAVNRLISIQDVRIPQVFADYREKMLSLDREGSLWQRFETAIRRHDQTWQMFLRGCSE